MARTFVPLTPSGAPRLSTLGDVSVFTSLDSGFLDQDRLAIVEGRRAAPDKAGEMVMTATAARTDPGGRGPWRPPPARPWATNCSSTTAPVTSPAGNRRSSTCSLPVRQASST